MMLIRTYRVRGHLAADLDPLGLSRCERSRRSHPRISTALPTTTSTGRSGSAARSASNRRPCARSSPCSSATTAATVGLEYMHINDLEERRFLQDRMEGKRRRDQLHPEGKQAILDEGDPRPSSGRNSSPANMSGPSASVSTAAKARSRRSKRSSNTAARSASPRSTIGMAHRGRLNVLSNVMGKPYRGDLLTNSPAAPTNPDDVGGSGDVKYHLGTSSDREFDGNKVHLSLLPNPSHLEAVDPVVLGKARAVQTLRDDMHGKTVLPILLHGDAAFAGQGIVAECFGFSGLPGYGTGGTIHFIINNQIGFTTSPQFGRSSPYPSDVAKAVQAPILHVNGDDPEAVTFCLQAGDRVPPDLRPRHRHRHVVLSPLRPQRGRRAELHPAADVRGDQESPADQRSLCSAPDRRGRRRPGVDRSRRRSSSRRLLEERIPVGDELSAQQGRLVRRPLDRLRPPRRAGARPPQHLDGDRRGRARAARRRC